jgi:hypothetical protein
MADGFDDAVEDGLALRVDPVQIFDQHQDRAASGLKRQKYGHSIAHAPCLVRDRERRPFRILDRQPEREHDWRLHARVGV